MWVGRDSPRNNKRADTVFSAAPANFLIGFSRFEPTQNTLSASDWTTCAFGLSNSSLFNKALVILTSYRGDDTISLSVWWRRILESTDSNFADSFLSTIVCIKAAIRKSPYGFLLSDTGVIIAVKTSSISYGMPATAFLSLAALTITISSVRQWPILDYSYLPSTLTYCKPFNSKRTKHVQ